MSRSASPKCLTNAVASLDRPEKLLVLARNSVDVEGFLAALSAVGPMRGSQLRVVDVPAKRRGDARYVAWVGHDAGGFVGDHLGKSALPGRDYRLRKRHRLDRDHSEGLDEVVRRNGGDVAVLPEARHVTDHAVEDH